MSLFDLSGKVALITGSSRGIGRSIAEQMAVQGAKVVISSRKQEACDQVAKAINDKHGSGTAIAVAASISDKTALENLVAKAEAAFGQIDILVCNAATNPYFGPLAGISDDQFRKILDNNILSNHWLVTMVVPGMLKRKDGSIVIISSIGGMGGSPVIGAYNVSKAADFQLARNYAVEYGRHNINVNCIAPGIIKTDFARALWENPAIASAFEEKNPMGRIGFPDEVAGAAILLASPAGRYINGQSIVVDGGSMAGMGA